MAGMPIRRARKTGAVDPATGEVVAFPFLPPVTGASKPTGWDRWSPAEKVEHLLGLRLDRVREYLSWPADGLDPYRLAAQAEVIRIVAMVAAKAGGRRIDPEVERKFREAMERTGWRAYPEEPDK
jgi:hypothetical protein